MEVTANRAIVWTGAGMFIASMFLPAIPFPLGSGDGLPGAICAIGGLASILDVGIKGISSRERAVHVLAFVTGAGNLWVLSLPIYARRLEERGRRVAGGIAAAIGALALTLGVVSGLAEMWVGYYVWMSSYFIVAAGFVVPVSRNRSRGLP